MERLHFMQKDAIGREKFLLMDNYTRIEKLWPVHILWIGFIPIQDELWIAKWREVIDFMETNHRNPSKHRIEEHRMLNWIKHNRKLMNAGELKLERLEMFRE